MATIQKTTEPSPNLPADAGDETVGRVFRTGGDILTNFTDFFTRGGAHSEEAGHWMKVIEKTRHTALNNKTIIGIVGATGAGKSSVVNALLEHEQVIPTDCVRACTSVVTEISYNDASERYRAEIGFIEPEDWEKELNCLFGELLDDDGNIPVNATLNGEDDQSVAYAKIKAVYPFITKDNISTYSTRRLMEHENVYLLGRNHIIKSDNAKEFQRLIRKFIDSSVIAEEERRANGRRDKGEWKIPSHWPLINAVKIYLKADVLSTGAILVDLPGVLDSNPARARVAERYMVNCTGLWIVAAINRAVNDKTAQTLLGSSFKRQLKMDGGFDMITFICSKTDDISVSEASRSLGIENEVAAFEVEYVELSSQQKAMDDRMDSLQTELGRTRRLAQDLREKEMELEERKMQIGEGELVILTEEPTKRKFETMNYTVDLTGSAMEDLEARLRKTKGSSREAWRRERAVEAQLSAVRESIRTAQMQMDSNELAASMICVKRRNEYSKSRIQEQFAQGIRELDQELAEEENPETFDPAQDARDYQKVAKGLPVFCVSSRGYQKIRGRMQFGNDTTAKFTTAEVTEIPQLQAHCKKIAAVKRLKCCQAFWSAVQQFLISISIWSETGQFTDALSEEERAKKTALVEEHLGHMKTHLFKLSSDFYREFETDALRRVFKKFDLGIEKAVQQATDIVADWNKPINREDRDAGGLLWNTYKAICRRDGHFNRRGAMNPHCFDWNTELAEPLLKQITTSWQQIFVRQIPDALEKMATDAQRVLSTFHASLTDSGVSAMNKRMTSLLDQQHLSLAASMNEIFDNARTTVATEQREINRQFAPKIREFMESVYRQCVEESGGGSFARMRTHIEDHVERQRHVMFKKSTDSVKNSLRRLKKKLQVQMEKELGELLATTEKDYTSALAGGPRSDVRDKALQDAVAGVIATAQQKLREALAPVAAELPVAAVLGDSSTQDLPALATGAENATLERERSVTVPIFVKEEYRN